jgi:lipoate-protein ligase A
MLCDSLLCIDDAEPKQAALNMAVDEALLLTPKFDCPTLRHYRWQRPSVSLGYFTRHAAVPARYAGWDLVRRWTGGGIVEHQGDFTYSLLLPVRYPPLPAEVIYWEVQAALAVVLRAHGLTVNQSNEPDAFPSDACFERAVRADLKVAGSKVAGAALRRHRKGVLLQGSVQDVPISDGMLAGFAAALAKDVRPGRLADEVLVAANALALEKYSTPAWNRRF